MDAKIAGKQGTAKSETIHDCGCYSDMKPLFPFLLLLSVFLLSCGLNRNIHFREGKTGLIRQQIDGLKNDTLVVFEPVIGLRTVKEYDPARQAPVERAYREVFNGQLDHYLAMLKQPHLMVRGSFLKTRDLQQSVFLLNQVRHTSFSFDSLPLPKNFTLPANKPALIIYHELGFRSEFNAPDADVVQPVDNRWVNLLFDQVLDIRSYALLIKERQVIYYRSNRVEFDRLKSLRKHYKTGRIYKRILEDLFAPGKR
jgi:hypothetical protein